VYVIRCTLCHILKQQYQCLWCIVNYNHVALVYLIVSHRLTYSIYSARVRLVYEFILKTSRVWSYLCDISTDFSDYVYLQFVDDLVA